MSKTLEPIFIICTGRSGSTLLRYILDNHEMIYAPQELHMGVAIVELLRINRLLFENQIPNKAEIKPLIQDKVRSQIDEMVRSNSDSQIWCDKSISSIDHLPEIMSVFPKARYIFLHRDCLDFVHSALEVSKYGFEGFGFEKHVLTKPKNIVDSLVDFWCTQAEKRILLQKDSNHSIYTVKYEDLVINTEATVSGLFDFLQLPFQMNMLDQLFSSFKAGKGDLKVQSSNRIENNTGKGKSVPLKKISAASFLRMNKNLKQLGYPIIPGDYNFLPSNELYPADLLEYISERTFNYISNNLKKTVPHELLNLKVSIKISELIPICWNIDFATKSIHKVAKFDSALHLKLTMKTLQKLVDQELNISMSFRDGLLDTNATYQQINEIGKFLFNTN